MTTIAMMAMASLCVPRVERMAVEEADRMLDTMPRHEIGCVNWAEFPDKPRVKFAIAHSGGAIYLKYFVEEDAVRAVYASDNNRPWEESCVEFFVSPDAGQTSYCNLEMSATGWGILHGGRVELVERLASLGREPLGVREGCCEWTLTLVVPVEALGRGAIETGERLRGNFYKCGDKLPRPHYLSWSRIEAPRPDFHRPEQFGELVFL